MKLSLRKLGPGFIFAGAAIGVSHLVQSTRAGADFGFGLIWALLLINAVKYPFFEFGPRYAAATGQSMIEGYSRMGKTVVWLYFAVTFATMFTIQTAVTIVTAGIASSLFGVDDPVMWTAVITALCFTILVIGRYKFLDSLMKIIVIGLTISTLIAVGLATGSPDALSVRQVIPTDAVGIAFLIAFMGWMPAPLDISVWNSIWTVEKKKLLPQLNIRQVRFDFNVGYVTTTILALGFTALGALVMYQSGESFSPQGSEFANQLISMYTSGMGNWAKILIGIAAFTTMFSTTLTTLDGSPRVMHKTSEIMLSKEFKRGYLFWLSLLAAGTLFIFFNLLSEMQLLVDIATILSFLTAPFYAIINFKLLNSSHTPEHARPSRFMNGYSLISIIVLMAFSGWYLSTRF